MTHSRFGAGVGVLLGLAASASAIAQTSDLRGIYAITGYLSQLKNGNKTPTLNQALNVPGVDGVLVLATWAEIEPEMGQFQWTNLDQWVNQSVSLGKKVELAVTAGAGIPSWVFQPAPQGGGASPLEFTVSSQGGALGACTPVTAAAPWDTAYIAQWNAFLAALAAHLKSTGAYDSIALLRLTGINDDTDELRLPAQTPAQTGLACVTDAVAIWQKAGYRPALLLQGWDAVTDAFKTNFPEKSFSMALILGNEFPPIGANGAVTPARQLGDLNAPLEALAAKKFPQRLVIQHNFLLTGMPADATTIGAAQTVGALLAFQTNNWLGSSQAGAACGGVVTSPQPCTAASYLAELQTGIYPLGQSNSLMSQYLEVFPPNIVAFPDAIQQAHGELTPGLTQPLISDGGIVIHAGVSATVSPGSLVDIYGAGLAKTAITAPAGQSYPTVLGTTRVLVNGTAAPLIYVGSGQIIFQLPYETAAGMAAVVVSTDGAASAPAALAVAIAAPSILTYGQNRAVAQNPDFTVNDPQHGVAPGAVEVLYWIGSGPVKNRVASGKITPGAPLEDETLPAGVSLGKAAAKVSFAGLTPGFVGLAQVNFEVPQLAPGDYPVQITIGNAASNSPLMTVSQ